MASDIFDDSGIHQSITEPVANKPNTVKSTHILKSSKVGSEMVNIN